MKRWMTPLATLAGTAVMLACARAQQTPVPSTGDNAQTADKQTQKQAADKKKNSKEPTKPADTAQTDTAKDPSKADDKKDDAEPKRLFNSLTLGYQSWNSSGNNSEMNQHGFVQGGFGVEDLSILVPFDHKQFYSIDWMGNPGQDFGAGIHSAWGSATSLVVNASQFSYFDPSVGTVESSFRKDFDATLNQELAPNFGVFASAKVEQDQHEFPAPIAATDFVNRTVAVGAQKDMGSQTIGATFFETHYSDLTTAQPSSLTDRGQLTYIGSFGPRFSATGTLALTRIAQQGQPDDWIRDESLSGVYDMNDASYVGGHVSEQDLDLNQVQDAYVRRKLDAGLNYSTRIGDWGLGLGYGHREEERVRADHSYVDVPEWNSYSFKLNSRIHHDYLFGVKGTIDDLSSAPVFLTDDPMLLYWSRKVDAQAKLSTGNETNAAYLTYDYRYRENSVRQFSITTSSYALGASRTMSDQVLAYAELGSDQYNAGGPNPVASTLGGYFANDETLLFGLDYTRNSREDLSFVFTSFYTEDEWGQQVALTYRRDLGKERNFQITYSPWLQRDRLYDVDTFTAPILTVKFGFRF